MKNIFKNSYFGKVYKTRNNQKALLLSIYENNACLAIEDGTLESHYSLDGTLPFDNTREYEIISEWNEPIDEEKLNEVFNDYIVNERVKCGNDKDVCKVISTNNVWLKEGFEAGYCKGWKDKK